VLHGSADLEGNNTPPILAMSDCLYPLYARHKASGSKAPREWREALEGWAFPEYLDISPRAIAHELGVLDPGKVQHYRLYHGTTQQTPLDGMFSYFPCQPWDGTGQGFERPIIRLEGLIDGTIEHGQRMNPQRSPEGVRALWKEVTRQVLEQGLALCVAAPLPEKRPAPHSRKASHAGPADAH
jgi:hypothetical protein